MLFFRSEEHVDSWCSSHQIQRRPLISLTQLWRLATAWYESRLTIESRRPAADEITGIFAEVGLEGPFWHPSSDQWS